MPSPWIEGACPLRSITRWMGARVAGAKQSGPAGSAGGWLQVFDPPSRIGNWQCAELIAIRRMQGEQVRAAAWQAAVAEGAGQLERDEGVYYGPRELDDITESAMAATIHHAFAT